MKFNLLSGGPEECIPTEIYQLKAENWCGVDIGAVRLIQHQIIPQLAIGDFDTATFSQLQEVQAQSTKTIYRPLKDDITDTELAIRYLIKEYQVDNLTLYGLTGGRMDQLLANLFWVLKPEYHKIIEKIKIIDRWNEIQFFLPGKHCLKKISGMKYLAFIPLSHVKALELTDEKYQLVKTDFEYPTALSSNEFIGNTAHFSFESGILMTVQSKDE